MEEKVNKPGIYKNIPMEEYKTWDAVHKSMFHSILKSGKHLKHYLDNGETQSDVMKFGNIVDTLLFEPDLFSTRYIITPETYPSLVKKVEVKKPWNWKSTFCKEWKEDLIKDNPEINIVSDSDLLRAHRIVDSINSHPEASEWLTEAVYQVSMVWVDPDTGLTCKSRPDAVREDRMIDLKITNDPHPQAFARTANNFKYHCQGSFYHDGEFLANNKPIPETCSKPFSFIVAEDKEPFDVVCYNLGLDSFDAGRIVYREALGRYKEIIESGEYCGYSNVAEELEIPHYALNKIQLEGIV